MSMTGSAMPLSFNALSALATPLQCISKLADASQLTRAKDAQECLPARLLSANSGTSTAHAPTCLILPALALLMEEDYLTKELASAWPLENWWVWPYESLCSAISGDKGCQKPIPQILRPLLLSLWQPLSQSHNG